MCEELKVRVVTNMLGEELKHHKISCRAKHTEQIVKCLTPAIEFLYSIAKKDTSNFPTTTDNLYIRDLAESVIDHEDIKISLDTALRIQIHKVVDKLIFDDPDIDSIYSVEKIETLATYRSVFHKYMNYNKTSYKECGWEYEILVPSHVNRLLLFIDQYNAMFIIGLRILVLSLTIITIDAFVQNNSNIIETVIRLLVAVLVAFVGIITLEIAKEA